jgi:SAM-dependent methyltransferase
MPKDGVKIVTSATAFEEILAEPAPNPDAGVFDMSRGKAFRLSSGRDAEVAEWLIAHHDLVKENKGLGAVEGPLRAELHELTKLGDFDQIVNDMDVRLGRQRMSSFASDFLLEASTLPPGGRALEVGCSCGRHLSELINREPELVIGVDLYFFALVIGARLTERTPEETSLRFVCADAHHLPFKSDSFDQISSFGTLNLLNIEQSVQEFRRILKPGGRLILTFEGLGMWSNYWDHAQSVRRRLNLLRAWVGNRLFDAGLDWQKVFRPLSHQTQLGAGRIESVLRSAGFNITTSRILREYQSKPWIIGVAASKA